MYNILNRYISDLSELTLPVTTLTYSFELLINLFYSLVTVDNMYLVIYILHQQSRTYILGVALKFTLVMSRLPTFKFCRFHHNRQINIQISYFKYSINLHKRFLNLNLAKILNIEIKYTIFFALRCDNINFFQQLIYDFCEFLSVSEEMLIPRCRNTFFINSNIISKRGLIILLFNN